jgi:uncharacterized protein (TIGR03066 family)
MHQPRCLWAIALFLLAGTVRTSLSADVDPKKLTGAWEVEAGPASIPKGLVIMYAPGGKLKVTSDPDYEGIEIGAYALKGDELSFTILGTRGKGTIKELTERRLVWRNEQESTDLVLKKLTSVDVDAKKLVGTWEVESGPVGLPKGTTMTFTADLKVKIGIMGLNVEGGTYDLKGAIITIKPPPGQGREGKARIKELTDTKLVIKDDAEPKELVLKRVKKED